MLSLVVFGILLAGINGHIINRASIKKLQNDVENLQRDQEDMYKMLDSLETNLTAQISKIGGTMPGGTVSISQPVQIDTNFEKRLSDMEGKIEAIKNYLLGEKQGDILLREKSEEVIKEMKGKVQETGAVIDELKVDVQNSLKEFEIMIGDVNKTANVKINSNGAVLYGGIGSACTSGGDECLSENSECRGGRCQCIPGMSYNLNTRTCGESCEKYGETYQSVNRRIIRGFNDDTVKNLTLAECKKRCIEDTGFLCRSIDYFPHWHTCYMSASVKSASTEDAWEYNSEGIHFQRDCEY